jgi:hypothetical protein
MTDFAVPFEINRLVFGWISCNKSVKSSGFSIEQLNHRSAFQSGATQKLVDKSKAGAKRRAGTATVSAIMAACFQRDSGPPEDQHLDSSSVVGFTC